MRDGEPFVVLGGGGEVVADLKGRVGGGGGGVAIGDGEDAARLGRGLLGEEHADGGVAAEHDVHGADVGHAGVADAAAVVVLAVGGRLGGGAAGHGRDDGGARCVKVVVDGGGVGAGVAERDALRAAAGAVGGRVALQAALRVAEQVADGDARGLEGVVKHGRGEVLLHVEEAELVVAVRRGVGRLGRVGEDEEDVLRRREPLLVEVVVGVRVVGFVARVGGARGARERGEGDVEDVADIGGVLERHDVGVDGRVGVPAGRVGLGAEHLDVLRAAERGAGAEDEVGAVVDGGGAGRGAADGDARVEEARGDDVHVGGVDGGAAHADDVAARRAAARVGAGGDGGVDVVVVVEHAAAVVVEDDELRQREGGVVGDVAGPLDRGHADEVEVAIAVDVRGGDGARRRAVGPVGQRLRGVHAGLVGAGGGRVEHDVPAADDVEEPVAVEVGGERDARGGGGLAHVRVGEGDVNAGGAAAAVGEVGDDAVGAQEREPDALLGDGRVVREGRGGIGVVVVARFGVVASVVEERLGGVIGGVRGAKGRLERDDHRDDLPDGAALGEGVHLGRERDGGLLHLGHLDVHAAEVLAEVLGEDAVVADARDEHRSAAVVELRVRGRAVVAAHGLLLVGRELVAAVEVADEEVRARLVLGGAAGEAEGRPVHVDKLDGVRGVRLLLSGVARDVVGRAGELLEQRLEVGGARGDGVRGARGRGGRVLAGLLEEVGQQLVHGAVAAVGGERFGGDAQVVRVLGGAHVALARDVHVQVGRAGGLVAAARGAEDHGGRVAVRRRPVGPEHGGGDVLDVVGDGGGAVGVRRGQLEADAVGAAAAVEHRVAVAARDDDQLGAVALADAVDALALGLGRVGVGEVVVGHGARGVAGVDGHDARDVHAVPVGARALVVRLLEHDVPQPAEAVDAHVVEQGVGGVAQVDARRHPRPADGDDVEQAVAVVVEDGDVAHVVGVVAEEHAGRTW